MPDWLLKIITLNLSGKTGVVVFVALVGLIPFWRKAIQIIESSGVPENLAIIIYIIMAFSLAHILTEVLIKIWSSLRKLISKYKQRITIRKNQDDFQDHISRTIPHLPRSQLKLLKMLSESEQTFGTSQDGLVQLEHNKYIRRIHKISVNSYIYQIDETVKDVLIPYLASVRKKMLDDFVINLTKDEKHFLRLFFSEVVPEGTRECEVMMEHSIFRAGESMSQRSLLEHFEETSKASNRESFRLLPDTSQYLQKKVFNQSPMRTELNLDSKYIRASGSSGSGYIGIQ